MFLALNNSFLLVRRLSEFSIRFVTNIFADHWRRKTISYCDIRSFDNSRDLDPSHRRPIRVRVSSGAAVNHDYGYWFRYSMQCEVAGKLIPVLRQLLN